MVFRVNPFFLRSLYNNILWLLKFTNKTKIFSFFLVGCPEGWDSFRDWCYFFNPVEKTYVDATAYCKKIGGVLVYIEDQEENNFIFGKSLYFFSFFSARHAESGFEYLLIYDEKYIGHCVQRDHMCSLKFEFVYFF